MWRVLFAAESESKSSRVKKTYLDQLSL